MSETETGRSMVTMCAKYLDRKCYVTVSTSHQQGHSPSGVEIPCLIRDLKFHFGTLRLLVKPVLGRGAMWVTHGKVRLTNEFDPEDGSLDRADDPGPDNGNGVGAGAA